MDDKGKVFQLAPPDVDLSSLIPNLRISVWKIRGLEPSYKVVFGCICESAFNFKFKLSSPGIVRRAKVAVSHACGLSLDTVRRAARELSRRRLLETTVCWEGFGEMTYWFIAGAATQRELDQAYDEATGRTMRLARRPRPNRGNDGKFSGGQPGKPTETGQMRERHGVSQPSERVKSAATAGQVSGNSGASQRRAGAVAPSLPLTYPAPTADLPRAAGVEPPRTRNVGPAPEDLNVDKAYSIKVDQASATAKASKGGKLSPAQKGLADGFERALGNQWEHDAGKWVNRIKASFGKAERVLADFDLATREGTVKSTPAQYVEQRWKEFTDKATATPSVNPKPAPKPAAKPAKPAPASKPLTEEELVAGAEYLAGVGMLGSATKAMREAYARHLEAEAAKSKLLPKKGSDHANPT